MQTTANLMLGAARAFLAALASEQGAVAQYAFDDDERYTWHFTPVPRRGVMLGDLDPSAQMLAHALISSGYSPVGSVKAHSIMSLEDVLRVAEQDISQVEAIVRARLPQNVANALLSRGVKPLRALVRNPAGYYLTIFGEPSATSTWGWRLEGHHVSLHATLVDGQRLVIAPSFFGANPAEVRHGPHAGLRVLAEEEDRARDLLQSLNADQRARAVADPVAPRDILSFNQRRATHLGDAGVPADALTAEQRARLDALVAVYADALPHEAVAERMAIFRAAPPRATRFAWMGGAERGEAHYYRVQTPDLLVEYDCTQDEANHIHSVWRSLPGDWADDLLGHHLEEGHLT